MTVLPSPRPWPEPDMLVGLTGGPSSEYGHPFHRFVQVPIEVLVPPGLTLFHGTSSKDKFQIPRGPASFSLDSKTAQLYADHEGEGHSPRVMMFQTIRQVRCIDHPGVGKLGEDAGWWLQRWTKDVLGKGFTKDWGLIGYARVPDKLKIIEGAGYDGIVIRRLDDGGTEVCIFHPERFVQPVMREKRDAKMTWTGPAASTPAPGHPVTYYGSYTKDDGNQYPTGNRAGSSREDQEQDEFDESLVPYREAGIVDRDELRDLAAIMGPAALATVEAALQERTAESVALIMVPADPPGKIVSDFIRRVAENYSRIAVCLYPASIDPERAQTLLELGLPDVQDRLQIHEIPAPTISAALSAGEMGSVKSGHGLDIYVPEALASVAQRELSSGRLPMDTELCRIVPDRVPADDPDRIKHALEQPTDMVAKQVLDPHVFSDPDGVRKYRHALGEGVVKEFLWDISPKAEREEGADVIRGIVERYQGLLRQRGVDTTGMQFLGMGNNGLAWKLQDGRVLKVTTDDAEAAVAVHLKGLHLKHVFQVHDVWAFPGQYEGHHVYGLLTEAGLKKPSDMDRAMFGGLMRVLNEFSPDEEFEIRDLKGTLRAMMDDPEFPVKTKKKTLELVKQFDLPGIAADFQRLGVEPDLHAGNIMQRPDGSFVVIDIGTGGDQEKAKPPFIEQRRKSR